MKMVRCEVSERESWKEEEHAGLETGDRHRRWIGRKGLVEIGDCQMGRFLALSYRCCIGLLEPDGDGVPLGPKHPGRGPRPSVHRQTYCTTAHTMHSFDVPIRTRYLDWGLEQRGAKCPVYPGTL